MEGTGTLCASHPVVRDERERFVGILQHLRKLLGLQEVPGLSHDQVSQGARDGRLRGLLLVGFAEEHARLIEVSML